MQNRRGFTVVELLVVVTVGIILMSVAMNSMASFQNRTAVRQARDVFLTMHARARAQALEFGQNTLLGLDPSGDSVWISRNDTVLSVVRLRTELGVDVEATERFTLCMTSRGYADSRCNSFGNSSLKVAFTQGDRSTSLEVLPLGQVIY
jgi:type II secretory pathway pseudopilin PulG